MKTPARNQSPSQTHPTARERPRPSHPGVGHEFLAPGKLRRVGDEFFSTCGWVPTSLVGSVVKAGERNLYRRPVR